tara:strand:+ start:22731 stop:23264 length:534 start_codon:yes stop_codon:yes gene_type:complete
MTNSSGAPTGLIRTDPVVLAVWTRLTSVFATWRAIALASFTGRALRLFSNDQLTPLTRAVHWKIGLGLLGGLDDVQIDFLHVYADLNAQRIERIFRFSALVLITVPVSAVIAINELQPDIWLETGFGQLESLAVVIGCWMLLAGVQMAAAWRARDLADLLVFEQARRRQARDSAAQS